MDDDVDDDVLRMSVGYHLFVQTPGRALGPTESLIRWFMGHHIWAVRLQGTGG
jgi:hypothetical protein